MQQNAKARWQRLGEFLVTLVLTLGATVAINQSALADTLGYPNPTMACEHAPYSATGSCANYDWGPVHDGAESTTYSSRGYGYRNCTDYVAWKLQQLGVADAKTRGLGNGGQWADNAASHGLTWSTTPKAGTAAVVPGNPGHVAYVESVNAGGTITVSEYNHDTMGNGDTRTATAASMGFTKFVDFGISAGSPGPTSGSGVGNATYLGTDRLVPGQRLGSNQYILSPNVRYALVMQADGNLVLYGSGYYPLWNTGTVGHPGAYAIFQPDGNLVVYPAGGGPALWNIGPRSAPARLQIQDDDNLVLYNTAGQAPWSSGTYTPGAASYFGSDRLTPGQRLGSNQYLRSPDGRYAAVMQADGNFVIYGPGYHVLWNSGTPGHPGAYATLQTDGNFVIYPPGSVTALWYSGLVSQPNSTRMQSDGNFVTYNTSAQGTWNTSTIGRI